jgi:protein SCO1/2
MKMILLLLALAWVPLVHADQGSVYDLDTTWTNQDGQAVPLARLAGKPRIVVLFFSRCGYACPLITADLQKIEQGLPEIDRNRVGFVMASFDSARDVPSALKTFAETKGLTPGRWLLLHGAADQVRELAAVLNVRYRRTDDGNFDHANVITVLDDQGRIVFQREGLEGDPIEVVKAVSALLR